ncbi:MAG: FHA domain-containing protein [Cyanobacteriota bacterium]|nr:FHA domain-containing protein [Cyanobacteriota bacterium]
MLTLTLLHPIRLTPIQSWEFSSESLVQIGRSLDNDIVLYSSVVSRHHLELRNNPSAFQWDVINLGANGTYVDGELVGKIPVVNNTVLHLAKTGPKLLLRLGQVDPSTLGKKAIARPRLPQSNAMDLATGKTTFLTARIAQRLAQQKPPTTPTAPRSLKSPPRKAHISIVGQHGNRRGEDQQTDDPKG